MPETRLDLDRIRAARRVIDPMFLDTPLFRCDALGRALGCAVSIKLETANPVRSFKARGTELVASQLSDQGRAAAVCASAGNLGWALAWSGRRRGVEVTVVASRRAPAAKLDRIRALGAVLTLVDGDFDMARERAASIARQRGIRLVEDSLDIEIATDSTDTIADGVAGRHPIPAVLDDLLKVADDAVLVPEASIVAGMRMLLEHAGLVVEPSAALGVAAVLLWDEHSRDRDHRVGVAGTARGPAASRRAPRPRTQMS